MGRLDQILHYAMFASIATISAIGAYYHIRRENAERNTLIPVESTIITTADGKTYAKKKSKSAI